MTRIQGILIDLIFLWVFSVVRRTPKSAVGIAIKLLLLVRFPVHHVRPKRHYFS